MMTKLALVMLAGCATSTVPAARFHNASPIVEVSDRIDVPVAPAPRTYVRALYQFRGNVVYPLDRQFALDRDRRALGVNALDEVPDSTWFTNRIGVRDLSSDELRRAADEIGTPELHLPWTVNSTKVGGAELGLIITDARGEKFILKFDVDGYPETETASDAIVSRILWALGYNVPEDHVVYFKTTDLVLDPKAKIKDVFGHARPLTQGELAKLLAKVDHDAGGRIRGLASHMLAGTWLGGHPGEGTRPDDRNDRIAHELRRDLRGTRAIFAWLDHEDIKEDNSLDMWVKDPSGQRYVKHYQIDFGAALGASGMMFRDRRAGHEYTFDFPAMFASFASFGMRARPWENRDVPTLRGVGLYDLASYEPGAWKPNNATYLPFHTADRIDSFWAAKLMMRLSPAQLAVLVEAGRLSDPRAAAYLTKTLVARQRATARYWFEQVNPLDRFEVVFGARGYTVCFTDLALAYQLAPAAGTQYAVTTYDREGERLAAPGSFAPAERTCSPPIVLAPTRDGYTIAELHTTRGGLDKSTYVHLARDGGAVRVVGVWRQ